MPWLRGEATGSPGLRTAKGVAGTGGGCGDHGSRLESSFVGAKEDVNGAPQRPRRQFAAVAAASRDRVDLGLRFTDPPTSARLQPGGGPGQATHKVSLRSVPEVDAEVVGLLRAAYEQNG